MTVTRPFQTPVTFGLYRRRTNGETFAVWCWNGAAERVQGPLTDPDPERPPSDPTYDRNTARFVRGARDWDPAEYEAVGASWHLEHRHCYLPIATARAVARDAGSF